MLKQPLIKKISILLVLLVTLIALPVYAENISLDDSATIDRVKLVAEQTNLLKNRLKQSRHELADLQKQHDSEISQFMLEKASKNLLDKASLDISVSKSNLESINIELTDSQQTISWLNKNIQEIENQLNVLGIFGLKVANNEVANVQELRSDLNYQKKLLSLEKDRLSYLQDLQTTVNNLLQLKKERYGRINALLKSRTMMQVKQQQVKDELAFQEQQNYWLELLNHYNERLAKVDPTRAPDEYAALERNIFYANESANYAYSQSLVARYTDQIQQMKLGVLRSTSLSLLNEIGDQVQTLAKQLNKLDGVLKTRINVLDKHITNLSQRKRNAGQLQDYLTKLSTLKEKYKANEVVVKDLTESLSGFRSTLDKELQSELSLRQGFPSFGVKTLLDMGKETLLVPALAFQVMKSLSTNLLHGFKSTSLLMWGLFIAIETFFISTFFSLRKILLRILSRPSKWRDKISSRWLSLQWLYRNFLDLFAVANVISIMWFFKVPLQNYIFICYLATVWLVFKSIMTIARLCLVETTHDDAGHGMQLYQRLKWAIWVGGLITALAAFMHLLPLIYELKTLCDRLFLVLLMVVSLFLLRSWHVVPNLILSHMEERHPYFGKSVRLIGILIPVLMLGNSIIGIFGFVNLIMTVSWYEGIFLIVLIGYLMVRGLLSDGMEQVSRLVIQYVNNGWLWTEAFLKPLDKILRIVLFFTAVATLFLLYGWDQQSPIVERLTGLLHYELITALKTTITPVSIIELAVVISVFYWTAKWIREFVYRMLLSRTKDMGIRNSIAILSQYSVIGLGIFLCLRVLGIDMQTLTMVASLFAFGIGLGLRDLANNFVCGFLILLERPLRVGDIVSINGIEGEVQHIGSRAVTVRTWDHMELMVPNAEIFYKSFTNWTAKDNVVRTVIHIKISRADNPHEVKGIIQGVLIAHPEVLKDPTPEVFLKEMNDTLMDFEVRYFVNIKQVSSRVKVMSSVHINIWDAFVAHGIKPPHPQHEIFVKEGEVPSAVVPLKLEQSLSQ